MSKLSIENVNVSGKKVLVRVDFNVPFAADGSISDDRRIRMSLPTIQNIASRGGRVILMSHLGRPSGTGYEAKHSLKPVASALSTLLNKPVAFPGDDCVGEAASAAVNALRDGEVLLLENLRFHSEETSNAETFARALAGYADIYCNDAFGTAHRAHASTAGVPVILKQAGKPCAAGLLMQRELKYLSGALENPARPFTAILGGAKVSDKLAAIENLIQKVDTILVGGAMAYTFLKVLNRRMGKSLVENNRLDDARRIIDLAAASRADLFFPFDHVCGQEVSSQTPIKTFEDHIEDGWMGLDIGPESQSLFVEKISQSKTILWNGPVGVFEVSPFDVGTEVVAKAVADATTKNKAISIIGGGDTAAAAEKFGFASKYSHVSTGGGASLELLEGKSLPGVEALSDA